MSRKKSAKSQFTPFAGRGYLFFDQKLAANVSSWNGHIGHPETGERLVLQATAHAPEKKKPGRYDIKVVKPGLQPGDPWTKIGEFTMPSFGDANTQLLEQTPFGRVRAVKQLADEARGTQNCIRFRVLRGAGVKPQGNVVF